MEANGWTFIRVNNHMNKQYKQQCATKTWYGYGYGKGSNVGQVSAKLKGSGAATLNFGNCFSDGNVEAHLNKRLIGVAQKNTPNKSVTFAFSSGDVLMIQEDTGIIKLNSLKFSCKGTAYLIMTLCK